MVRFVNDILLSAPSIVIGLFIYEVMVMRMGHFSGLPAPRRCGDRHSGRGAHHRKHAAAGARRFAGGGQRAGPAARDVVRAVTCKAAQAGIVTGVLLAVARISGETAPLLFTALNNQFYPTDLNAPMASLPAIIFQFAMSPYKDWQGLAWTGALLITLTVLGLSILARTLARKDPADDGRSVNDTGKSRASDEDLRQRLAVLLWAAHAVKNVSLPLYTTK